MSRISNQLDPPKTVLYQHSLEPQGTIDFAPLPEACGPLTPWTP